MNLLQLKNIFLESVGFENIGDFVNNIGGMGGKLGIPIAGIFVGIASAVSRFITGNIYDPALGIYILVVLTGADMVVGVSLAIKKNKFDAGKISRAGARLVTQIFLVGSIFKIYTVWPVMGAWVVDGLLLSFVISTFWSIFKNAAELGWIDKQTYDILERILSLEELVRKLFKKK